MPSTWHGGKQSEFFGSWFLEQTKKINALHENIEDKSWVAVISIVKIFTVVPSGGLSLSFAAPRRSH